MGKQKARPEPGKDTASQSVVHCAACGAAIHVGEPFRWAMLPIGFNFAGQLIAERLRICGECIAQAEASTAGAEAVQQAVSDRYHAAPDAVFVPSEFKGGLH